MNAHVLLNLLNEFGKRSNARLAIHFIALKPMSLINSIIQEHKCRILFIISLLLLKMHFGVKRSLYKPHCHGCHNVMLLNV